MKESISRRKLLGAAGAAAAVSVSRGILGTPAAHAFSLDQPAPVATKATDRIVDMHVHFDDKRPTFIADLLKVCDRLGLTACVLTPYEFRNVVAGAARQYPAQIIPFGSVDLDAPDVVKQVQELHAIGYRGLGEIEFVQKQFTDPSYFPVYELANEYRWIVMFHTGIVLRRKFEVPENVASYRMRAFHLEEIARRFPKITVLGAHCGNPEYEWAGEVARWNPNVFFDVSGSTLMKMQGRLGEFRNFFWWSDTKWKTKTPEDDSNAFVKLVFGSDVALNEIEGVLKQYRAMFNACDVPEATRKRIMGGTLAKMLGLPD